MTNKKKRRAKRIHPAAQAHAGGDRLRHTRTAKQEPLIPIENVPIDAKLIAGLVGLLAVLLYAYWPTLVWMEDSWRRVTDYSHGYLVLPLAAMLCWHRADSFPGLRSHLSWGAISLIALSIVMRIVGRLVFADFMDAWSLLPLIAGVVWLLAGPAAMRWALPAIAFLFFMIPMPYQAESLLSWKLQGFATHLSTVFLRVVGFAAVSEGHVIWLGEEKLQVAEACSGLRIFIGVVALAVFWAAMIKRSWVDRIVLLLATIPLAIFANALRITAIGVMYKWFPGEGARDTIHGISGLLMIPFAFFLLWGVKMFWEQLYRENEQISPSQLAQELA